MIELYLLIDKFIDERNCLLEAIKEHHSQKADDRCIFDDDKLYAAAGLPPCDRRVGDKFEMIKNCMRFVDKRCESGGWKTYAELEKERDQLKERVKELEDYIDKSRKMTWSIEFLEERS